ncbi:putative bifunctional diguanylate cyclase/phosphodiesterase [Actinoplanes sp. NPDC051494]|uniref:putative bifunctional diguanylate cyclase/phosphodiesterase n=1 Tax=Actinoplanes sp. NPDC051494 TaxID=3363907 RepID=UPI0037AD4B8A
MFTRATSLTGWLPTGGGLRDEDWARRHRLLTLMLAACVAALTGFGAFWHGLDRAWLVTVLLILPCVVLAVLLPPRRLPSVFVALGFTIVCGGFVSMAHGLTEAHFTFFIAVAALALYRDWAPFGMFLVATTLHHAVFGVLVSDRTYDHHSAMSHPLLWAILHGVAVLAAAGFQVVAWKLTEAEEKRAQENLDDSQAQLNIAFDETPVPTLMLAPDGRVMRTNAAYRTWLGLPDELPPGFSVADLPITPVGTGLTDIFDRMRSSRDPVVVTRQYQRHADDALLWVETHGTGLYDAHGTMRAMFVHCIDVTRTREHEAQLQYRVRHDQLTGLLSRSGFEHDIISMLTGRPLPATVLYLDVDRFKAINDGSGHATGDEVLRALGVRLQSGVPRGSLAARLGGDEFVIALPVTPDEGRRIGEALIAAMAEPLVIDGNRVQLSVSIGLAGAQGPGEAERAVLSADTAMYAAKRGGGNRLEMFSDQMRVAVQDRIVAEARLRAALDGDLEVTLPVWFQPIVAGADGRIIGAEALVRMRTPQGEILAPGHFIGAAEETGLVVPLGEHVLVSALRHLMYWNNDLGYVSVNVSPRQLSEPGFVPMLAALLARAPGLDPSRLVLEITETAVLATSGDFQSRLYAIKALGVRIALDDFGTGYSSLTWLQSVPADVVKLDRSFVAGLATDPRKASIISATLWLAQSLGMTAVAEGVEEVEDWQALRAAGCPALQGYYFSRPLPPAEFDALLRSGAGHSVDLVTA